MEQLFEIQEEIHGAEQGVDDDVLYVVSIKRYLQQPVGTRKYSEIITRCNVVIPGGIVLTRVFFLRIFSSGYGS